jgi:multiple sugar transport system ATP-binding protein
MASIKLSHITKRFGAATVIKDIDLDIVDGDFLVLLGPSGCGKSTLLRMLAGLETVSEGAIHLEGKRVDGLPPSDRDMAFVFQSYALYPHMTVRKNIGFPLVMRHFKWWFHVPLIGALAKRRIEKSAEVAGPVARTAKILALTDMLDRLPKTLSGGQRQRVALGRAMVRQPKVFLMDEPLSNLDAKLRTSMRAEISRLHRELKATFVYVTHDQVEAMTMGTKIALLREGTLQQFGSPREIYEDPANIYVAGFIGVPAMNLIEATVEEEGLRIGGSHLALPAKLTAAGRKADGPVYLGIRPNALRITREAPTADGLVGTVVLVEHVGAESNVEVRLAGARSAPAEEGRAPDNVTITLPGYSELPPGAPVSISPELSNAVLFSARTGERLRA